MLACALFALALDQQPITIPAFRSWDGAAWAGVTIGLSENDLGKRFLKAKTLGPDPASVRIVADKKGWIVAAILTEANNKGSVAGITVDMEHDEPIESLEALQAELGPPDYTAFPPIRYGDWSLAVWKDKGIAAAVRNGSRPLVQKVLLAPASVLARSLDLWQRDPNPILAVPRLEVTAFDVAVSTDPQDRNTEDVVGDGVRYLARRLMGRYDGAGWVPMRGSGTRIRSSFQIQRRKSTILTGTVSSSYRDSLGDLSVTESSTDTLDKDRNSRDAAEAMFDDLTTRLAKDLDSKYRRLTWQTEWRQFTGLVRPKL